MNLNAIPLIGHFFSFVFNVSMAIPFWAAWTYFGLGKEYFDFLPAKYQSIGFWSIVGLFIIVGTLKALLMPSVSISNTNKEK